MENITKDVSSKGRVKHLKFDNVHIMSITMESHNDFLINLSIYLNTFTVEHLLGWGEEYVSRTRKLTTTDLTLMENMDKFIKKIKLM